MKISRLAPLLLALLALTLLAACGNKGDLVKPDAKTDTPATH
jgi:predicted small lipoprotein YifL